MRFFGALLLVALVATVATAQVNTVSITPSNLLAAAATTLTVSFKTNNALVANDKIQVALDTITTAAAPAITITGGTYNTVATGAFGT